jgi:hypothetical protein
VFDYFFPGVLPGSPVSIPQEVIDDWNTVYVLKIGAALAANPAAAKQLVSVMRAAVTSDPTTVGETVAGALWYNVFATNDVVTTLGGQPFDNHNRIYTGSQNDLLLNRKIERITADPVALAAVKAHYETSGKLMMPTITIHTTLDPVIPYWQETLYSLKTLQAGAFFERTNLPISSYGHCAFTGGQVLAAFGLIVLRDIGQDILTEIETTLAEPHRSDFAAAVRTSSQQH